MRSVFAPLALLILLCAAAIACAFTLARAETPSPPPPVHALHANEPIVVDGVLDEPVWRSPDAVRYLPQSDPNQNAPSAEKLEIRVAFDDDAVYFGARLFDSHPDSIVARVSRRDNEVGSDMFLVYLDTFHDRRTGYYFGVTAAGTQFDGTLMNDGWDDDTWDGVWSTKVRRDGEGWTAEMRIPFSQLRSVGGEQRVWGVNFKRFISRYNQTQKLVFTPTGQSGFVSRFPDLVGLDGIRSPHHVEVTPYTTGRAEYLAHRSGDPFHDGSNYVPGVGGDLRTNVGDKLTLNATVNPDFGQVEIDPASVNLSDVETYYSEKRPFFTEGTSVFYCGNNGANDYWNFNWPEPTFFYARRIGRAPEGGLPGRTAFADVPLATHILGAVKLTGQPAPRFNFGTLHAVTRKETAEFELGDSLHTRGSLAVEPTTYYGILRGIRSFNSDRQGLGLMTMETHRFFDGTNLDGALNGNGLVAAMDGWTFVDAKRNWVLSGYGMASRIDGTRERISALQSDPRHYFQRPDRSDLGVDRDATSLAGYGGRLWLNRQNGPWLSNSAIGVITPGFEANDLGYSSRDDVINGHVGVGYNWDKPGRFKKYFWIIGAVAQNWNFAGQHTLNQLFLKSQLEQMNAWSWTVSTGLMTRTVSDRATRGGPVMQSPASSWFNFQWDTNSRSKFYLSNEANLSVDVEGSHEFYEAPSLTWHPSSQLSVSVGPSLDWNHEDAHFMHSAPDTAAVAQATYGTDYVFATLQQTTIGAQARVDCSFTPTLTLQVFAQPLVSSGRYSDYRALARGDSYEFRAVAPGARDFTYRTVRGNAVLRWEYVPGSTLYFVWTQDRTDYLEGIGEGEFRLGPSLGKLATTPVNNIFMVKASHHFDL